MCSLRGAPRSFRTLFGDLRIYKRDHCSESGENGEYKGVRDIFLLVVSWPSSIASCLVRIFFAFTFSLIFVACLFFAFRIRERTPDNWDWIGTVRVVFLIFAWHVAWLSLVGLDYEAGLFGFLPGGYVSPECLELIIHRLFASKLFVGYPATDDHMDATPSGNYGIQRPEITRRIDGLLALAMAPPLGHLPPPLDSIRLIRSRTFTRSFFEARTPTIVFLYRVRNSFLKIGKDALGGR